jgi:dolichol-phosphate mannosyltransferase
VSIQELSTYSPTQIDRDLLTTTPDQLDWPILSVVIPTRNEAGNIGELVHRLTSATRDLHVEILFVDDSTDNTPQVIRDVESDPFHPIVLEHRRPEERTGGLGGAVTRGMAIARAPWVCVMDADLQHPPELVPSLLKEAQRTAADVVVASRYCEDGEFGEFSRMRTLVSEGSTMLARMAFPGALRGVTDPMSGFFLIRREAVDLTALQPRGFKILFEILCRTPKLHKTEVPFRFGERHAGESKAGLQEGARYVRQLLDLRFGPAWLSFVKFGLVGISGILINSLALAFFGSALEIHYLLAAILATQFSTAWNFSLTEGYVFDGEHGPEGRIRRGALFFAMNNAALGLRGPMLYVLVDKLHVYYVLANLISLVALMVLRFVTADRLIWKRGTLTQEETPAAVAAQTPFATASVGRD